MAAATPDCSGTISGTQVQVLRRWRYFDPMLGEQVECSHLMNAAEAHALDADACALPGTEVTIDHSRPVRPRWL